MRDKAKAEWRSELAAENCEDSFFPESHAPLLQSLYSESEAERWKLSFPEFRAVLERSARKSAASASAERLQDYLRGLHVRDLGLASGCAAGCEAAWEHFVSTYRSYLRAAAGAILRCPPESLAARELADSLFAELYGMGERKGPERSLFRYFHGRSALKTWLRAVMAQRHIDQVRASKRQVSLDDEESERAREKPPLGIVAQAPDPHREHYLELFRRALDAALRGLESADLQRLRSYYAEEQTLAAIGRKLGEHESSVSRNLERIRRTLREKVETLLRAGFSVANGSTASVGLSDAEIALCFTYAAEDAPIDLDQLLAPSAGSKSKSEPAAKAGKPAQKVD
jgi:RNA polymerase sigma factor (sigma-70 family)